MHAPMNLRDLSDACTSCRLAVTEARLNGAVWCNTYSKSQSYAARQRLFSWFVSTELKLLSWTSELIYTQRL